MGVGLMLSVSAQDAILSETDITAAAVMDVTLDEDTSAQDLGIKEPRILSDSPFYFFKEIGREIQSFITFNPIKKAELKQRFADEKLIEMKKIIKKTKNPELIKKAAENYKKELEKVEEVTEKIKEKVSENPKIGAFLDKFTKHQLLHQNLLQKLETQVPVQAFEKIKEARQKQIEKFGQVMNRLEDKIQERLEKNMEEMKGSKYKDFKNLEILKELEEKIPEQAKEAIRKTRENSLKRLKGDLEKMSPKDQKKFGEYIDRISGEKEKHLEILENLKSELKEKPEIIEKILQSREKILKKIKEREKKISCPQISTWAPDFCKDGRIIPRKDEKGCIVSFRCILPGEIEIPKIQVLKEPHCDWCGDACVKINPRHDFSCPTVEPPADLICTEKNGKCITKEKPEVCIMLWDPVCGKNGKTYSNTCFAEVAGVEIDYKGVCKSKEELICEQKCKSLGYNTGICRNWATGLHPKYQVEKCKNDEINIGYTVDCRGPRVGGNSGCCCKK